MTTDNKTGLRLLALFLLPFLLNDFATIYVRDYPIWMALDLLLRVAVLAGFWWLVRRGELTCAGLGLVRPKVDALAGGVLGVLGFAVLLRVLGRPVLMDLLPEWSLATYPVDRTSGWFLLDMSLGLALVAISEELVCRALAWRVLRPRMPAWAVYLITAALFAAMHWCHGTVAMAETFAFGLGFMACYRLTGSIWPPILAHYLLNLYFFK